MIENYRWPLAIIMLWPTLFLPAACFFYFFLFFISQRSAIINKVRRVRGTNGLGTGFRRSAESDTESPGGIIRRWSSILAAMTESTRCLFNQFGIYRSELLLLLPCNNRAFFSSLHLSV